MYVQLNAELSPDFWYSIAAPETVKTDKHGPVCQQQSAQKSPDPGQKTYSGSVGSIPLAIGGFDKEIIRRLLFVE